MSISCLSFPFLRAAIGYRIEKPCKICNVWPRRNGYKLCTGNFCQYTSAHFPRFPLSGNAQSENDDAHKQEQEIPWGILQKEEPEEASRKEEELRRIEEKVRQSWEEAERTEAGARQMEYSAMVREAATHYKEVEVKHEMAEAKNARPMSRSAKPKSIARRKMHGIGSLKPG
jgi:hypothetical protein